MATKTEKKQKSDMETLKRQCSEGFRHVLNKRTVVVALSLIDELASARCSGEREDFVGWISQLERSLASVPANILEGFGYASNLQKFRFLRMARGSALESVVHAHCSGMQWLIDGTMDLADELDSFILEEIRLSEAGDDHDD